MQTRAIYPNVDIQYHSKSSLLVLYNAKKPPTPIGSIIQKFIMKFFASSFVNGEIKDRAIAFMRRCLILSVSCSNTLLSYPLCSRLILKRVKTSANRIIVPPMLWTFVNGQLLFSIKKYPHRNNIG